MGLVNQGLAEGTTLFGQYQVVDSIACKRMTAGQI